MDILTKKPFRDFNLARPLYILILFPVFVGFIILFIWLTEYNYFANRFPKAVIALMFAVVFFMLVYVTLPLPAQFYFFAKFRIKTTRAEARYLEPLLGTYIGAGVIKWYPLNRVV
jgi:hypothetical protein